MLVSYSPHSFPPFNSIICRFLTRLEKKIRITQIYFHSVLIPKFFTDPVYTYPTSVGPITAASGYVSHPFCKRDRPSAADSKEALIPFPVRWLSGVHQCSAPCPTTGCPGFAEGIASGNGQGGVHCVYTKPRSHFRTGKRTAPWTCKLQASFLIHLYLIPDKRTMEKIPNPHNTEGRSVSADSTAIRPGNYEFGNSTPWFLGAKQLIIIWDHGLSPILCKIGIYFKINPTSKMILTIIGELAKYWNSSEMRWKWIAFP